VRIKFAISKTTMLIRQSLLLASLNAQTYPPKYPKGCSGPTFPNSTECLEKNWNLGEGAEDKCAPLGPYPVAGQMVYIKDPLNFCMMLPDPDNDFLKANYYSQGRLPTIVQAEGYVRAYCMGDYLTPGALTFPPFAIRSAHVIKNVHSNGKEYMEISGQMDCNLLNIDCDPQGELYADAGQYDSVGYRNCGKEPYSGVDPRKHPKLNEYVEQAGNSIYCMRVCEAGQQLEDPCNVKNDTAGCIATMGVVFRDGFSFTDMTNGGKVTTYDVSLPPISSSTSRVPTPTPNSQSPSSSLKNSFSFLASIATLAAGIIFYGYFE
jgi:hypothetical protein